MSGALVRAGGAFVEVMLKDESVRTSLEKLKSDFRNFGSAVNATTAQTIATVNTTATAGAATSTASMTALTGSMISLRAVAISVGGVFRATFNFLTVSVTRSVGGLAALSLAIARFAGKNSLLGGFLNKFLSASQTTEALGRWTRFAGALTGSSAFRTLGNQIERLGLGSAIVAGFQRGLVPGIASMFGAAFRSAKSSILSAVSTALVAPFRAVAVVARSLPGPLGTTANAMTSAASGATTLTGKMWILAGAPWRVLKSTISSLITSLSTLAFRTAAFSAAITGPAFLAARSFASAAAQIMSDAKETGKSIAELVQKKYGVGSLISVQDIQAGKALSDAMTNLKQAVAVAWAQIGVAALPVLQRMTEFSTRCAEAISGLLNANRGLLTTIVNVAAKIGGGAAALYATYQAAVVLGPILASLMSPLGLIAVGIVGIAIAFPQVRAAAADLFSYLGRNFGELVTIVQQTVAGIFDALAGGDLKTAGEIAMTGLRLAWVTGTEGIYKRWLEWTRSLKEAWVEFTSGLRVLWQELWQWIGDTVDSVITRVLGLWKNAQNIIAGGIARLMAAVQGLNPQDVLNTLVGQQEAEAKAAKKDFDARKNARKSLAAEAIAAIGKQTTALLQALGIVHDKRMADLAKEKKALAEQLDALNKKAAESKEKRFERVNPQNLDSAFSASIGSFSAFNSNRIGVAGVSQLQKSSDQIAQNTKDIADNTKNLGGLAFA